jgi:hypothetical protein
MLRVLYLLPALLVIVAGLPSQLCGADEPKIPEITVATLVKNTDKYDQKTVKISGVVTNFKAKTFPKGNKYVTFDLQDGDDSIHVFAFGEFKIDNNDKVTLTAQYEKGNKELNATRGKGGSIEKAPEKKDKDT